MVDVAYHYDITITPDRPKKMMRPVWEAYRKSKMPKLFPAFDEVKNVYSPVRLPDHALSGEVQVKEDEFSRDKEYKVVLKHAADVNLKALMSYMRGEIRMQLPQDALQCIDIVLRNAPATRLVRAGRSYFSQPKNIIRLGDGTEMWNGFYQSAILGWKPFLNVDVAHKSFPTEMSVIDLIAEFERCSPDQLKNAHLGPRTKESLAKHIKALKIRYEIPNQPATRRTARVNGIKESARDISFVLDNGTKKTVYQYFQEDKRYTLRYPTMPCIWVGSREKNVCFPAEFCTILKGQVTNRKMNEMETRTMVKYAATSTEVRKDKIMYSMKDANYNRDPCVQSFGISVNNEFERVPARVLEPPHLEYCNKKTVRPAKGVWRPEGFLIGQELQHWTVLVLGRTQDSQIDYFCSLVQKIAQRISMVISPVKKPYARFQLRGSTMLREYFQKNSGMQLIFVIIPEFPGVYANVKREAELNVGCLTQCIKEKTFFKSMNDSTVGNILLKVNSKLNGLNHKLADRCRPKCLMRPCMIMGADVTHPSPEARDRPSVAAVAASHDLYGFSYNICWRLQPPRQEIIQDLEEITREQLLLFYQKFSRTKPESIIFFRDGVSEGQFQQVRIVKENSAEKNQKFYVLRVQPSCYAQNKTYLYE